MTPGYVRLVCEDPRLDVTVLLGADPVRITAGVGGWNVTTRPRQVGMVTWQGSDPFAVELPLMFDGWGAGKSQETTLRRLLAVARGDDVSPPGIVRVYGVPLPAKRWVIENVDYGDAILNTSMRRLRQALTLTLREYVPPEYLQLRKRALQGGKSKTRVLTSRKNDTPARVAARAHCKWTDLRTLNPKLVKKANQALKTGTKLRAPAAQTTKTRGKS